MNRHSLIRSALLTLAMVLAWSMNASAYDQRREAQGKDPADVTPAECEQYRQEKQALIDSIPEDINPDTQEGLNKLTREKRQRLQELRRLLQGCV